MTRYAKNFGGGLALWLSLSTPMMEIALVTEIFRLFCITVELVQDDIPPEFDEKLTEANLVYGIRQNYLVKTCIGDSSTFIHDRKYSGSDSENRDTVFYTFLQTSGE